MDSVFLMTMILLIGLGMGVLMNFLMNNIIKNVAHIQEIFKNNKLFKEKQAEVAKMKAAGDMHEWISVPMNGVTTLVCKKTGYAPSFEGFVPMQLINSYLENLKAQEDYKVFRDQRVQELSKRLNIAIWDMEKVVEDIFSIKKDFAVMRISKLQQELQDRSAAVKNEQSQV